MFSQAELDRLIEAMRANGVVALAVDHQDQTLNLNLDAVPSSGAAVQDTAAVPTAHLPARSPSIGLFVPRGADDGLPELFPAAKVALGDTLGYIAQRQIRALVFAPVNGVLASDIPDEGAVFGHGDVVFDVEVST